MNAQLQHTLNQERLQALHAEAQRERDRRAARPEQDPRPRLPGLLARLHLRARPA